VRIKWWSPWIVNSSLGSPTLISPCLSYLPPPQQQNGSSVRPKQLLSLEVIEHHLWGAFANLTHGRLTQNDPSFDVPAQKSTLTSFKGKKSLYRRSCAGRTFENFCNLDFLCKTGLICAGAKICKFSYPHNLQSVRLTMSALPPHRGVSPISACCCQNSS
jgi:hypothetical protein